MSTSQLAPMRVFDTQQSNALDELNATESVNYAEARGLGSNGDVSEEQLRRDGPDDEPDDIDGTGVDDEEEEERAEEIDESVRKDMKRLEGTFPGISRKFRLVNRIGEGMILLHFALFWNMSVDL